jgi:hypothetical protein
MECYDALEGPLGYGSAFLMWKEYHNIMYHVYLLNFWRV